MKLSIAITGASGAIYAKVLLDKLQQHKQAGEEIALVWTDNAKTVWEHELGNNNYRNYSFRVWDKKDFNAPFASGSAGYDAMIICPCSMGTLGRIAAGVSDDLITRAADVMLKERKKLICVPRETPFNAIHLRNMMQITEAGGVICPAIPSFYSLPQSFEEMASTVVSRVLSLVGIATNSYSWGSEGNDQAD